MGATFQIPTHSFDIQQYIDRTHERNVQFFPETASSHDDYLITQVFLPYELFPASPASVRPKASPYTQNGIPVTK